jgi:hypothetical protein
MRTHPSQSRNFSPCLETLESRLVPTVTYHGGPLLTSVQLEAIYIGSLWSANPGYQQVRTAFDGFLGHLVNSSYMDMLNSAGYGVGRGAFQGSVVDPVGLGSSLDDSAIQNVIQAEINSGAAPSPTSQQLYIVYVSPNVLVTAGGQNSQHDFLGYHDDFTGRNRAGNAIELHYAVIPYEAGVNASIYGFNAFDGMTEVSSHEISEAVTDPEPERTPGWYDGQTGEEIGDIVAHEHVRWDSYLVQKEAAQDGSAMAPPGTLSVVGVGAFTTANGSGFSGVVATFFDGDTLDGPQSHTVSIDWGDGTTSAGTLQANGSGWAVTGSHAWHTQGNFTVTVSVTNSSRDAGKATEGVTVGRRIAVPAGMAGVASALTHSDEYYSDFVASAYQKYLGRPAAGNEIQAWVGMMHNGLSDEAVVAGIVTSAEYMAKNGSGSSWIASLYHDLLGRAASQSEINGWLQNLAGGMAPLGLARAIATSIEAEAVRVVADYDQYLHRTASAAEVTGFVSAFMSGASNEDIAASFVGSLEYFQSANMDSATWLTSVYVVLFSRQADSAANSSWLPLLG